MKKVYIISIFMALVVGVSVYFFTDSLKKQAQAKSVPMGQVVVAIAAIPANTLITEEMVEQVTIPRESISSGAVTDLKKAVGTIAKHPIFVGEQIFYQRLSEQGAKEETLSYVIEDGYRAVSIGVDDVTGVSGFISAGDYVDVVASLIVKDTDNSTYPVTEMLVENLKVLEIGMKQTSSSATTGTYATVTLAATPEQVLKINFALTNGRIYLSLRPILDHNIVNPQPVGSPAPKQTTQPGQE